MNLLDDLGRYKDFEFIYPDIMIDAELELKLKETCPCKPEKGYVPEYRFSMVNTKTCTRSVLCRLPGLCTKAKKDTPRQSDIFKQRKQLCSSKLQITLSTFPKA